MGEMNGIRILANFFHLIFFYIYCTTTKTWKNTWMEKKIYFVIYSRIILEVFFLCAMVLGTEQSAKPMKILPLWRTHSYGTCKI